MPSEFLSMPVTLNCYGNPIISGQEEKTCSYNPQSSLVLRI